MKSNELEYGIVGLMLYDLQIAEKCVAEINLLDFTDEFCKSVFHTAQCLYGKNITIDIINTVEEAKKMGIEINVKDLSNILHMAFISSELDNKIKALKEYTYKRTIAEFCNKLYSMSQSNCDIEELIKTTSDIPEFGVSKKEPTTSIIMQEALNRMVERYKNPQCDIPGNKTGFNCLDKKTGGIKNSEIILITADPNVGKSLLAHQIAINSAKSNKQVAFFSFEMSEKQLGDRTVALALPFEIDKIKFPKSNLNMQDLQYIKGTKIHEHLDKYLHFFTDECNKTIPYIKSKCKKIKAITHSLDLIIVDYLQLMDGKGEEWEIAGKNCKALKNLAREFDCPVIVIASLDKQGKVRGSGQIDYDVDQKWYLRRPSDAEDEISRAKTELIIQKNRDGGKGIVKLLFQEKYIRFLEEEW